MRLLPLALLLSSSLNAGTVQVWQDTLSLLTWSEGLPDVNPQFELYAKYAYPSYPYAFRANFLTDSANLSWRQLNLENEYLFCRVLPDLGGHLYSCRDKINGKEVFYANPVIHKDWVALRGAWVPVGIELNFPIGHSLTTVSPVNFGTTQNPDGSAGVWVADIDRQTGLEWRVEWIRRPGSAILEEQVWLYNRGDSRQPYYFWSTSEEAIQDQNSGFQFPMRLSGTHGFTVLDTWPVNQAGVDMSMIRNLTDQTGLFAYGSNEPFLAAYHPATRTGTAHYSDPSAMPGKKLWAWGPSGDAYVQTRLTQNFPSYIEIQAGTTPNQETRLWLDPQQSSHFSEYWMPIRELDGVSRANLTGVGYLGRTTANGQPVLMAEFNANAPTTGVTVNILNGSTKIFSETVNLDPKVTYIRGVANPAPGVNYTFQIVHPVLGIVFSHTENTLNALGAKDVTLGPQPQPDYSKSDTDQQVLARAQNHEQYMQYGAAESDYSLGLRLFPQSNVLLKAAGRLAVLAARFPDAVSQLTRVPVDSEVHYYLGLAYAGIGQFSQAAAAWTGGGPASTFQLACLRAFSGDLSTAASLFDSVNTLRAGALEVSVLRRQGKNQAANSKLAQWQGVAPTDFFLRNEAILLGASDASLTADLSGEPERVPNLVDDYFRLGFWADAVTLLSATYPDVPALQREPGTVVPQNNALVAYYRGYAKQQLGLSSAADFAAASAMPLQYLFPNRLSEFAVLRAAIQANSSDASAHFLLGLLYMNFRQVTSAINEWESARSLKKNIPTLHRNLGRAYLDLNNDANTALIVLREGLVYDPNNYDVADAYQRALQLATPPTVPGPPIPIYSTGVSAPNNPLPDGAVESHYKLIASADASSTGPNAYVVDPGYPFPTWIANSAFSKWIGPRADASVGNQPGSYTYRTTFDLTGFDPATAVINGRVSADYSVVMRLNGVAGPALSGGSNTWSPFALNSGFVSGLNTLDFVVTNESPIVSPTGLRVEVSGSANVAAISVSVSPAAVMVTAGQTQAFTSNQVVTWSTSPPTAGSISSAGIYAAPNSLMKQQSVTVTATSVADTSKSASATITLVAPLISTPSVTPNRGAGSSASFTFTFADTAGIQDINGAQIVLNASLTGVNSCYILFGRPNLISLASDDGGSYTSTTLGVPAVLKNSQCIVLASQSSQAASGNTLTLTLTVIFKSTFAGGKSLWSSLSTASGVNQPWTQVGSWTAQASSQGLTVGSVNPQAGTGQAQAFTFNFSDPAGASDLSGAQIVFNSSLSGVQGCYVLFNANNVISLANDAGIPSAAVPLGSNSVLENSQCALYVLNSSQVQSGQSLSLTLYISFKRAFSGVRNIYARLTANDGSSSGFPQIGTWTIPAVAPASPSVISVRPASVVGPSQALTLVYSDPNCFADISSTQVVINPTQSTTNSCVITFDRATRVLGLLNDNGSMGATSAIGAPATIQNSQCIVNAAASTSFGHGDELVLTVFVTMKNSGSVNNIYSSLTTAGAVATATAAVGTWNVSSPPTLTPFSVSPTTGAAPAGMFQSFTFTMSDPAGAPDISGALILLYPSLQGVNACYILWGRAAGLSLASNDATGFATAALGASSLLQNSQCTVDPSQSFEVETGNTLNLTVAVAFKAPFQSFTQIYSWLNVNNAAGAWSGWGLESRFTVQ